MQPNHGFHSPHSPTMSITQPLSTAHADLITSLSFSLSSPSLLASSSLDGHVRVHARLTIPAAPTANGTAQTSQRHAQRHEEADGETADEEPEAETQDQWVEVGSCKANEGPVWKAIWGPREYGTSILVSISGSVVHIWGGRPPAITSRSKLTAPHRPQKRTCCTTTSHSSASGSGLRSSKPEAVCAILTFPRRNLVSSW